MPGLVRRPCAHRALRAGAAVVALVLAACGGSGGGPGSADPPAAPPVAAPATFTVTITALGAAPRELQVPLGAQVTFVNQDTRTHQMMSDPHPVHTDCSELNTVGTLDRGQARTTAPLTKQKACGFHDNMRDGDTMLRGQILVGGAAGDPDYRY